MSQLFDTKVVVITGAGRGLGRAHALAFAAQGARVVVNDLGVSASGVREAQRPADEVVNEIRRSGGEASADTNDVAAWQGAERLLAGALATFGRVDVLVLNAAITRPRKFHELSLEDWHEQLRVNLGGTVIPSRIFAAHWAQEAKLGRAPDASILCTTSKVGLRGAPFYLVYGCTKAAIACFVQAAAIELEPYGIRVNGIAPRAATRGMQDSTRNLIDVVGQDGLERLLRVVNSPPPWEASRPDSVSPTALWLTSSWSRPLSGVVINVDVPRVVVQNGWHDGIAIEVESEHTVEDIHRLLGPLLMRNGGDENADAREQ